MTDTGERRLIRDAMERLLAGSPIRSNGALTIVTLATEAGIKRHLLTHRHTDLRDEFYDRVRSQGSIPHSEVVLRDQIRALEEVAVKLRARNKQLSTEVRILRRMNNVISVEKAIAEERLSALNSDDGPAVFKPRHSRRIR